MRRSRASLFRAFNNRIDSFVGDPRTFGATLRVKF